MTNPLSVIVAFFGAVVVIICAVRLFRSQARLDLVVPVFLLSILAMLSETNIFADARQMQLFAVGALLGLGAIPILSGIGEDRPPIPFYLFFAPLLGLWVFGINAVEIPTLSTLATFQRLAPVVVWAVLVLIVSSGGLRREDMAIIVTMSFGVASAIVIMAPDPWTPCTQFKCGPFGALFAGPFTSENYFARLSCVALLCAFLSGSRAIAGWTLVTAGFVLFATGSRTSELALGVALAAGLLWYALSLAPVTKNRGVTLGVAGAFLATGLYLVYTAGPADFSNRGTIWILGRTALTNEWGLGRGIDTWTVEVLARNFMHSQALMLLYSAGVVAVALYVAFISGLISSIQPGELVEFMLVMVVLTLGLTEIVWNPVAVDGTVLLLLALLCAAAPKVVAKQKEEVAA